MRLYEPDVVVENLEKRSTNTTRRDAPGRIEATPFDEEIRRVELVAQSRDLTPHPTGGDRSMEVVNRLPLHCDMRAEHVIGDGESRILDDSPSARRQSGTGDRRSSTSTSIVSGSVMHPPCPTTAPESDTTQ